MTEEQIVLNLYDFFVRALNCAITDITALYINSSDNSANYITRLYEEGWTKDISSSAQVLAIEPNWGKEGSEEKSKELLNMIKEKDIPYYIEKGCVVIPQKSYEKLQDCFREGKYITNTYDDSRDIDYKTLEEAYEARDERLTTSDIADDKMGILRSDKKFILFSDTKYIKIDVNGEPIRNENGLVSIGNEGDAGARAYITINRRASDVNINKDGQNTKDFIDGLKSRKITCFIDDNYYYIPYEERTAADVYAMTHDYNIDFSDPKNVNYFIDGDAIIFTSIRNKETGEVSHGSEGHIYQLEAELKARGFSVEISDDNNTLTLDMTQVHPDIDFYENDNLKNDKDLLEELKKYVNEVVSREIVKSGSAQFDFIPLEENLEKDIYDELNVESVAGYISSSESPDLDEPELDEQEAEPGDQELDITEENADKEPTNEVEIESIKDASKKIAKEAEKVKEAYEAEWDAFMEMADGQIPEDIDTRTDVNVARDMDYPIFDFKVSADDDTYLSRHDYEKKMSHHYSTFRDFFLLVGRNGIDETEAGRGIKEIDKVSPIGEYTMEAWLAKTVTERLPDIKIRQARNIIEEAKANYGRTFRVEENPNVRNPFVSDDFTQSLEDSAMKIKSNCDELVKGLNVAATQYGFKEWRGYKTFDAVVIAGKTDAYLRDHRNLELMAAYLNCPVKDLRDNIKELAKGIEKVRSISEGLGDPKAITEAMQKDAKRKLVRIAREMSNGVEGFEFVIGTYETIRILKRTINVAKNSAKTVKAANARLKEAYRSSEFYEKQLQKKVEKLKKKTAKPAEKINEKKLARRKSTVEAARTNSRRVNKAKVKSLKKGESLVSKTRRLKNPISKSATGKLKLSAIKKNYENVFSAIFKKSIEGGAITAGGASSTGILGIVLSGLAYLVMFLLAIVLVIASIFSIYGIFSALDNYEGNIENYYTDTAMGAEFAILRSYEKNYYKLPYYMEMAYVSVSDFLDSVSFIGDDLMDAINETFLTEDDLKSMKVGVVASSATKTSRQIPKVRTRLDNGFYKPMNPSTDFIDFGNDSNYFVDTICTGTGDRITDSYAYGGNLTGVVMPITLAEIDCDFVETKFINGDGIETGRVSNIKAILAMSGVVFSDELDNQDEVSELNDDPNTTSGFVKFMSAISSLNDWIAHKQSQFKQLIVDLFEKTGFNVPEFAMLDPDSPTQILYGIALYNASHAVYLSYDKTTVGEYSYTPTEKGRIRVSETQSYDCACRRVTVVFKEETNGTYTAECKLISCYVEQTLLEAGVEAIENYFSAPAKITDITENSTFGGAGSIYTDTGDQKEVARFFGRCLINTLNESGAGIKTGITYNVYGCVGHPRIVCVIRADGLFEEHNTLFDDCAYNVIKPTGQVAASLGITGRNIMYEIECNAGMKTLFGSMWENPYFDWVQSEASIYDFHSSSNNHWSEWNRDWAKIMYDEDFGSMYHLQVTNVYDQHQQQLTNEQTNSILSPLRVDRLDTDRYKVIYYALRAVGHIPYLEGNSDTKWLSNDGRKLADGTMRPWVKVDDFGEPLIPDSMDEADFIYWIFAYCNLRVDEGPDYDGTYAPFGDVASLLSISGNKGTITGAYTLSPGDIVFTELNPYNPQNQVGIFVGYVEGSNKSEAYVVTEKKWGEEATAGNVILEKATIGYLKDYSYFIQPPCYSSHPYSGDVSIDPEYGHDYIDNDDEIYHDNKLQYSTH